MAEQCELFCYSYYYIILLYVKSLILSVAYKSSMLSVITLNVCMVSVVVPELHMQNCLQYWLMHGTLEMLS
jgi:hypothetical protein